MADKQFTGKITAQGTEITVFSKGTDDDFISLTDIARYKNAAYPSEVIQNWMRNRSTVEFLGLWERIYNPNFNYLEFEVIDREAGRNAFVLTPKRWIESVNAIGMTTKQGRYAATLANKDIAFKFAAWISAEFELYIIKDYQRLKSDEGHRLQFEWNAKRELSKVNYRIHTDAIKEHLIPPTLTPQQIGFAYANEADMLNMALFGITAKQWREQTPNRVGNIRDYADVYQLIVLINLESMNAELIKQGLSQKDRLEYLNRMAIEQVQSLMESAAAKRLNEVFPQAVLPEPMDASNNPR
ncbi:MAG: KilA-N domain-containing protein [Oscillospiraceae bacterium]|nr:KilA-N domain-containing protein [Oscillospiraceae bacterium]